MKAAAAALRRPLVAIVPPPHLRGRVLAGLGAFLLVLCLYVFWFRDSSFVGVQRVSISGLNEAPRLREELTVAAQTMSTLHVRQGRLDNVVAGYPAVERLEVHSDFPHTLRIDVIEFQPAAIVVSGSSRVAVAGDGRLLRGLKPAGSLPVIKLQGALPADRLGPGTALQAAEIAGAAPLPLRRQLTTVTEDRQKGLVAHVRKGPDVVVGDTTRLRDKWVAAARVLADKGSQGATYVDVRLPERPVAGGLPVNETTPPEPVTPTPATTTPAAPTSTTPASPTNP
ncbi:MAG: cell division protein FtsQ/DivIB [Thermoleophilaceae bacterium]